MNKYIIAILLTLGVSACASKKPVTESERIFDELSISTQGVTILDPTPQYAGNYRYKIRYTKKGTPGGCVVDFDVAYFDVYNYCQELTPSNILDY